MSDTYSEMCPGCGYPVTLTKGPDGWVGHCPNVHGGDPGLAVTEIERVRAPRLFPETELVAAVATLRASLARWSDPRGETVTIDAHALDVVLTALDEREKAR